MCASYNQTLWSPVGLGHIRTGVGGATSLSLSREVQAQFPEVIGLSGLASLPSRRVAGKRSCRAEPPGRCTPHCCYPGSVGGSPSANGSLVALNLRTRPFSAPLCSQGETHCSRPAAIDSLRQRAAHDPSWHRLDPHRGMFSVRAARGRG